MKTEASKVAIALIQATFRPKDRSIKVAIQELLGRYGKFESNARSLGRKTC